MIRWRGGYVWFGHSLPLLWSTVHFWDFKFIILVCKSICRNAGQSGWLSVHSNEWGSWSKLGWVVGKSWKCDTGISATHRHWDKHSNRWHVVYVWVLEFNQSLVQIRFHSYLWPLVPRHIHKSGTDAALTSNPLTYSSSSFFKTDVLCWSDWSCCIDTTLDSSSASYSLYHVAGVGRCTLMSFDIETPVLLHDRWVLRQMELCFIQKNVDTLFDNFSCLSLAWKEVTLHTIHPVSDESKSKSR